MLIEMTMLRSRVPYGIATRYLLKAKKLDGGE